MNVLTLFQWSEAFLVERDGARIPNISVLKVSRGPSCTRYLGTLPAALDLPSIFHLIYQSSLSSISTLIVVGYSPSERPVK